MPTIPELLTRCEPEGECLLWPGYRKGGLPSSRQHGSLRRAVFEFYRECELHADLRLVMRCGVSNCLNHEHMRVKTIQDQVRMVNLGRKKDPLHYAHMVVARRVRSPNNIAIARAVRADLASGCTTREAGLRNGISQSLASRIGRGEVWREEVAPNASVFSMRSNG